MTEAEITEPIKLLRDLTLAADEFCVEQPREKDVVYGRLPDRITIAQCNSLNAAVQAAWDWLDKEGLFYTELP